MGLEKFSNPFSKWLLKVEVENTGHELIKILSRHREQTTAKLTNSFHFWSGKMNILPSSCDVAPSLPTNEKEASFVNLNGDFFVIVVNCWWVVCNFKIRVGEKDSEDPQERP
jgi:hypothetical protein